MGGLLMNTLTAINPKYTALMNRVYKAYRAYHECVNLDGTFDTDKEERANERKQIKHDDNYCNLYADLPKREQQSFDRQHKKIHGYK